MSKVYEALGTEDVDSHSPPEYLGQLDDSEMAEGPSSIRMDEIPFLAPTSQAAEGVTNSSDSASRIIGSQSVNLADIASVYGPAGLVQVGQPFDNFQCLVERTSDFDTLRQRIVDELDESKPELELVALTIPGLRHERSARPKLTSASWGRLSTRLLMIGLVTRRKAVEVKSRNRKIRIILASVFGILLLFALMVVGSIGKINQARTSQYRSSTIVVTFKEPIAAGEQRTLQCINNIPNFVAAKPKPVEVKKSARR